MIFRFAFCIFLTIFIIANSFSQSNVIGRLSDSLRNNKEHELVIKKIHILLNDKNLVDTDKLLLQGVLIKKYIELHLWDSCLNYCQRQIVLAQQQNNFLAQATFYKFIGNIFYAIPFKLKAVEYWQKSIQVSKPNHFDVLLLHCYHNIGAYYLELGIDSGNIENYSKAEFNLLKAHRIGLSIFPAISSEMSLSNRLLGTLYEKLNQYDKSEKYYQKVINNSRLLKDSSNLLEGLTFYTSLLAKRKEFQKSIQLNREALQIAKITNQIDQMLTVLHVLSMNLYDAGNYKEAAETRYEIELLIRDRFKADLNNKIGESEAKFKIAEAEHEKQLNTFNAKKEKQFYLIGFVSILITSIFLMFYLNQSRTIKQKIQFDLRVQGEKERLSRDLHDNLGSQMALLSNNIETLGINLKKGLNIEEKFETVKTSSKQLLQTLREAIWILNKKEVVSEEFFDKLHEYAARYLQDASNMKLHVEQEFAETKVLNSNETLQLFRICQEAINNACKYSNSPDLILKGITKNKKFEILIEDSGIGFNSNLIETCDHFGISNMKKRAVDINAKLSIISKPGEGTRIIITV